MGSVVKNIVEIKEVGTIKDIRDGEDFDKLKVISIGKVDDDRINKKVFYYIYFNFGKYWNKSNIKEHVVYRIYDEQKDIIQWILNLEVNKVIYQDDIFEDYPHNGKIYDIRTHTSGYISRNVSDLLQRSDDPLPTFQIVYLISLWHLKAMSLLNEEKTIINFDSVHYMNERVLSLTNFLIKEYGFNKVEDVVNNISLILNKEKHENFREITKEEILDSLSNLVDLGLFSIEDGGYLSW